MRVQVEFDLYNELVSASGRAFAEVVLRLCF